MAASTGLPRLRRSSKKWWMNRVYEAPWCQQVVLLHSTMKMVLTISLTPNAHILDITATVFTRIGLNKRHRNHGLYNTSASIEFFQNSSPIETLRLAHCSRTTSRWTSSVRCQTRYFCRSSAMYHTMVSKVVRCVVLARKWTGSPAIRRYQSWSQKFNTHRSTLSSRLYTLGEHFYGWT